MDEFSQSVGNENVSFNYTHTSGCMSQANMTSSLWNKTAKKENELKNTKEKLGKVHKLRSAVNQQETTEVIIKPSSATNSITNSKLLLPYKVSGK
jgi:hypothetical protein